MAGLPMHARMRWAELTDGYSAPARLRLPSADGEAPLFRRQILSDGYSAPARLRLPPADGEAPLFRNIFFIYE